MPIAIQNTAAQRLASHAQELLDGGLCGVGIQASLATDYETYDVALGYSRLDELAMDRHTLYPIYCAGKPLLALAVMLAAEDAGLEVHESLKPYGYPSCCISELLSHSAGVVGPSLGQYRFTPRTKRPETARNITLGGPVAYSEVGAWILLERLLETLTGWSADEYIRANVLQPLGLTGHFFLTPEEALTTSVWERIGLYYGHLPERPMPMASELWAGLDVVSPATGVLGTMHGLGTLVHAVSQVVRGRLQTPALPSAAYLLSAMRSSRGSVMDPVLGSLLDFAGGFMLNRGSGPFGGLVSNSAFGHLGWLGTAFVVHDPATCRTLAALTNAVTIEGDFARIVRLGLIGAAFGSAG